MKENREQGRFEELIKAQMDNYEVDAPADMWANIEAKLDNDLAINRLTTNLWARYVAAAAVVAGIIATAALLYLTPTPTNLSPVAINQPIEEKVVEPYIQPEGESSTPVSESVVTPIPLASQSQKKVINRPQEQMAQATTTVEERVAQTNKEEKENRPQPERVNNDQYAQELAAFEEAGKQALATTSNEVVTKSKNGSKFAISLLAANGINSNSKREEELLRNASNYNIASDEVEDVTYNHAIPLSFGLKAAKSLSPNWSIETGLVYSILASEMTANHQEGKQILHYLGIPINAIWQIATIDKFQFYLTAGTQVDFNVYGSQCFDSSVENVSEKYYTEIEEKPQWSLRMRGGAAYQLISKLSLYLECGAAYYTDNNTSTVNVWKEQPLNIDLQLGLRTHF